MTSGYGDDFLKKSKYVRGKLPQHSLDWAKMPDQYKIYEGAERFALPEPALQDGPDIWKVIWKRRSVRAYTDDALTLKDLSQILWATQGVREKVSGANCDFKLRTVLTIIYFIESNTVAIQVEYTFLLFKIHSAVRDV